MRPKYFTEFAPNMHFENLSVNSLANIASNNKIKVILINAKDAHQRVQVSTTRFGNGHTGKVVEKEI